LERLRVHLAWRTDHSRPLNGELIRAFLPPKAFVCDLGCGDGQLMRQIASDSVSVLGVEPDATARGSGLSSGLTILDGSAESLPDSLPRAAFDAVVMSHALEHCTDPALAVGNLASLLKPGGIAIIAVPNNASAGLQMSCVAWRWLDVPRHLNFFTGRSLSALCQQAGLDTTAVEYEGYCRQFTDEWADEERRISTEFALPPPPSRLRLLAKTIFARPERKYDSVRVVAKKP
jgi:SAM-dependent methyltransferase